MTDAWGGLQVPMALAAAATLFLLQVGLSVALIGVTSLSRVALHRISNGTNPRLAFLELMREPGSGYRAAAALGRQLCLLGGVALCVFAARLSGWSPAAVLLAGVGAVAGALFLEVFLARIIAVWDPRVALRWTAPLVLGTHALLFPVVAPLRLLTQRFSTTRATTEEEREEEQEEQVEALIEVGERTGILEAAEGKMMRSIVDLDETLVREIMTPRTDIVALAEDTSLAEARSLVLEAGHSRIPIFRESIDNVIGVMHERDLLRACGEQRDEDPVGALARPVIFIPETLSVGELLSEMKKKKHFGLVVDEYGGVSGLVTLEDLLEEIVGEIQDEHDMEESLVRRQEDGSWLIDASAHVEELEERFGLSFDDRDFDTVGGLVVTGFGRVPRVGETLQVQGVEIEVLEADRRRIRLVRLRRPGRSDEARAAP